jgi:predicted nuclease of predicted toxin-antitoxin system
MKFVVDAQLPCRLAGALAEAGHDAIHTLDLPLGNRTPDEELLALAMRDGRVLVTKDSDFITGYWLRHTPSKLLLVSTGNITNDDLLRLFADNLPALIAALSQYEFVELNRTTLTVHA